MFSEDLKDEGREEEGENANYALEESTAAARPASPHGGFDSVKTLI